MLARDSILSLQNIMVMNRRQNLILLSAAAMAACAPETPAMPSGNTKVAFKPLAGVGVIAVQNGKRVLSRVEGFASGLDASENRKKRPFTADSPFRVASMSKVVVLLTARAMAAAGVLDLDADINEGLGLNLRHPRYPDIPVTLRHLLTHRSGISDPAVYWTEPSGDIRDLISSEIFKGGKPGEWFEYANINYGLSVTIMEATSRERFDRLTQTYVLEPLGLDAGFNWAGVSEGKRRAGATLYREAGENIHIQTDSPGALSDNGPVLYGNDKLFVFDDYTPGRNGTLLSPQGGLRASLNDLLAIAGALGDDPDLHRADWIYDGTNGADGGGHFVSFGPGLYLYPPELSPIPGQMMVGHHGEAYGMYGGLWHLPQINAQIVHAVTATPEPPEPYHAGPPAIAPESRILLDEAMAALGLS